MLVVAKMAQQIQQGIYLAVNVTNDVDWAIKKGLNKSVHSEYLVSDLR